jgi:hypothetical protein
MGSHIVWVVTAALVPVLVVLVIVPIDLWVYLDAKRFADEGAPVVLRVGAFVVDTGNVVRRLPRSVDHLLPALHGAPRNIAALQNRGDESSQLAPTANANAPIWRRSRANPEVKRVDRLARSAADPVGRRCA